MLQSLYVSIIDIQDLKFQLGLFTGNDKVSN